MGTLRQIRSLGPGRRRGGLFAKYFLSLVGTVTLVLLIKGTLDIWFAYDAARDTLGRLQQEKANAAADRVGQYIREIERQIAWTTHPQWATLSVDQRRTDFVILGRQVPDITELTQIDGAGREQLKVSKLDMDVIGSNDDLSHDQRFTEIQDKKVWYSPVYLRKGSEPFMSISLARTGRQAGATSAEINLKLIREVVDAIRVGEKGYAYVVDRDGRLVAHPDLSLVLRDTAMHGLTQVQAALDAARKPQPSSGDSAAFGHALDGTPVLSSFATIPALGWLVFVEQPTSEALRPLYMSLWQTLVLLGLGLAIAAVGAWFLSRRMAAPISAVSAGAARLGAGDLAHRIDVSTGDEIETLANSFNGMAAQLQESYADLERKVETRTRELARSVDELTASAEVLRLIAAAPDDLEPMFQSILEHGTRLCEAQFGVLWMIEGETIRAVALRNVPPAYAELLRQGPRRPGPHTAIERLLRDLAPVQIEDVQADPAYASGDAMRRAIATLGGIRTLVAVPLIRHGKPVGILSIYRNEVRLFTDRQIGLLATFADQAVIAIENSRLLGELRARTTELTEALENQTATADILHAISRSPTDIEPVLAAVVAAACRFCGAVDAAVILREDESVVQAAHLGPLSVGLGRRHPLDRSTVMGRAIVDGRTVHAPDISALDPVEYATARALAREYDFKAAVAAPMLREDSAVGSVLLRRQEPGAFTPRQIELLETFAAQAVIAIENVRLFTEIQEKSRQLELASEHKSQFLANMSHELRTPLNAIIGYTEMMADGLYGPVGTRAQGVLERVQANGRHLLGLINDVLDLTKIEAGQLTLAHDSYSVADMVASVVSATESLAHGKGLVFTSKVAQGLPTGTGDARRLSQVLLNLVGNAIKFTDRGSVEISAVRSGERFEISVTDSGPGIRPEDQARIFEEFQQVDSTSTRRQGGTGLGLSISRRIVMLHGGTLSVDSEPGSGSTFRMTIPINAAPVKDAA